MRRIRSEVARSDKGSVALERKGRRAGEAISAEVGDSVSKATDLGRGPDGRAGGTAGAIEGVAVMTEVIGESPVP